MGTCTALPKTSISSISRTSTENQTPKPQKRKRFSKTYKLGASIAVGTFGTVRYCNRIADGRQFAVKIVKKKDCTANELSLLQDEIDIYSSITHPHIINLYDVFENDKMVQMVMELCDDKTLSDMIYNAPNRRLPESDCAHIVQIIAATLKYLHSQQIIHRDLKPENILFTADSVLKITDFGSAFTKINREDFKNRSFARLSLLRMDTVIGTPNYVAPEILKGELYTYRCDLWSLGVILFECIAGYHPFSTRKTRKSINTLYAVIMSGQYKMEAVWSNIDEEGTDLMKKLIVVDPQQRITIDDVLRHPFIVKHDGNNNFAAKNQTNYLQQPLVEQKEEN